MGIDPLTPPDCDLRDFAFMPLDVVRLRDSDMAATESAEVFRAAVLLWCASWHQIPAGSIPNDDRVLSSLAGFGRVIKEWKKIKDGALRGWVECSDGRLYHTVVCEKALESHESKRRHAYNKMGERLRKMNKSRTDKGLVSVAQPTYKDWISGGMTEPLPPETMQSSAGITPEKRLKGTEPKGQGEVREPKGQGDSIKALVADAPKKNALTMLIELGVEAQPAQDWITVRKAKRAPLTQTALDDLVREAGKAGISVNEAVTICARKTWQGFNASWDWGGKGAASPFLTAQQQRDLNNKKSTAEFVGDSGGGVFDGFAREVV